jgi:hypothetical protein
MYKMNTNKLLMLMTVGEGELSMMMLEEQKAMEVKWR